MAAENRWKNGSFVLNSNPRSSKIDYKMVKDNFGTRGVRSGDLLLAKGELYHYAKEALDTIGTRPTIQINLSIRVD